MLNAGLKVISPFEGDFITEGLTIEVGGKGKNSEQVKHLDNYIIASENLETGAGNNVPVWVIWVFILNSGRVRITR
jgi:hypothetical protein